MSTLAVPRNRASSRDGEIRAAESKVYAELGLTPLERYVDVDTGCGRTAVRLTEFGADAPGIPLVLLHGVGSATVLAATLVPHLGNRRVIAVDWPGHGLSGRCVIPAGLGLRTHAITTLRSLLDTLALSQVDLAGHSLGAQFTLYGALDLGPRVRRAVALGAPGAALEGVRPVAMMKALAVPGLGKTMLAAPMSPRTFDRTQDMLLGPGAFDTTPRSLVDALYLIAGLKRNAPSIASFFRALIRLGAIRSGVHLTAVELGRLQQPVLAAWGDLDVFMTPMEAASSIVAMRDVHLLRLPTAGHAPWLGVEHRVGSAIAEHLGAVATR